MKKEEIEKFLSEFKVLINKDGGDFEILELDDNYLKLKIRGKRNRHRSRDGLYALINVALKNRFPGEKYKFEMEHWKVDDENDIWYKFKKFFKIVK